MKNSSNLRQLSRTPTYQFDFSNTIDDPIEIEAIEDPSEDSEQGSVCEEEASSEDNSQHTSSTLGETEMSKCFLDERATTVEEGHYEHTSRSTPSLISSSPSSFSYIFLFPCLMLSIMQVSPRSTF